MIESSIVISSLAEMANDDESWTLMLQLLSGTEVEVRALPSMSVEILENMAMERLSLKNVKLIHGDQVLLNRSASLFEAGLLNGTIVSVVHKSLGAFTALYEHESEPKKRVEQRIKAILEVSDDGSAKVSVNEYVCDESDECFDIWAGMGYEGKSWKVFAGNVVDYDGHQFTAMFTHLEEGSSSYPHNNEELCSKDVQKTMIAKIDGSTLTIMSTDLHSKFGDTWVVTSQ